MRHLIVVILLSLHTTVFASVRCCDAVKKGDHLLDVQQICGPPHMTDSKNSVSGAVQDGYGEISSRSYLYWMYKENDGSITTLKFSEQKLRRIKNTAN